MSEGRTRLTARDRRKLLLDAARRAFARHGFEATKVDDIAEEAGVAKSLLSRHWPTKEALFLDLRGELYADLQSALQETAQGAASTAGHLVALVDGFVDWLLANPDALTILSPVPSIPETLTDEHDARLVATVMAYGVSPVIARLQRAVNLAVAEAMRAALTVTVRSGLDDAVVRVILRSYVLGAIREIARGMGGELDGAAAYFAETDRIAAGHNGQARLAALAAADVPALPAEGPRPPWAVAPRR